MPELIEKGTTGAGIVEDEERVFARVCERAAVAIDPNAGTRAVAEDYDRELILLRDAIAEAKPEDLPPLVEQMTRLSAIRSKLGGSRVLPIDINSPYFAHMVLREGKKSREVLIGKRGFIDRKAGVQIVDWRNAPISQVYYRYEEGDDFDEEIDGRQFEGTVDVRRNVSISDARLKRIGTPQGTFVRGADGVWLQAVGEHAPTLKGGSGTAARAPRPKPAKRGEAGKQGKLGVHHGPDPRADKHLPEIAALIDPEQFELITSPKSGLIVIQGGAGSGKTTVALHRIAYLNFADRSRFKPSRILFVVPTESLVRYVAAVLPSLGVAGVPVLTYGDWARRQRQKLMRGFGTKYNPYTPDSVARVKKHAALLPMLEEYVAEQTAAVETELSALGNDDLLEQWHRHSDQALVPRLRKLWSWLKGHTSTGKARVRLESAIRRLGKRADDIHADWSEFLTDKARMRRGFDRYPGDAKPVSDEAIERMVAWTVAQNGDASTWTDDAGRAIQTIDGHDLDEDNPAQKYDQEDDPIILRLIQLKRGGLLSKDVQEIWYSHVAIDEAQDRSAIEVKVLLEATASDDDDPLQRSVTIAGDTAQRLVFDNNFADWAQLLTQTGHDESRIDEIVKKLHLSYRSTAEVMQLALDILGPELAPKEQPLVARSGAPVELHEFGDMGESVAFLADSLRTLMLREPSASVAVVARYGEQADAYYEGFVRAEVPSLRRVRNHEFTFAAGVDVTDVSQVKGLEFDYVIMVEVTESTYPDQIETRHLLHIGATRAAHQLWITSTGRPSKLLPESIRTAGMSALQ